MEVSVDSVIKDALLQAMDEFHRVCEENNLKYFLIGGSLIGAIRHKGYIPWDDDFDVVMFDEDFKQLLSLKDSFNQDFILKHRSFSNSELFPIARIENQKVIVDEGYYSSSINGVFIDVFCFEDTFDSTLLQKLHFKLVALFRILMQLKDKSYSKNKYSKRILILLGFISLLFAPISKNFLNYLMDVGEKFGRCGGTKQNVANLHGCWKTKEIAPKKLFNEKRLYEFEGRYYWSIVDADAWLRPIYGDYMQLPPIEDRKPKHIDRIVSINGVKVLRYG